MSNFDKAYSALIQNKIIPILFSNSVGDLQKDKGTLETKLGEVSVDSALGQLKGSDSIFEIYTESYGEHPIVIQGAGADADVTARGVFGDILRLAIV